jgi:hypothetical protein
MKGRYLLFFLLLVAASANASSIPAGALVKTPKQAIELAIRAAYPSKDSHRLWHARRHNAVWEVWKDRSDLPCARAEQMNVSALDGTVSDHFIVGLTDYLARCITPGSIND